MKKLAFYLAFITLSLNIQAQESQQRVKELEAKIQSLQAQIDEYQKALNIKNAPNYKMFENIKFSIESVEGNEDTGEVIVTIKGYNNGPDNKIFVEEKTIIDNSGRTYKTYNCSVNDGGSSGTFYKDTPGSIKITFTKVQNSPSRFSNLILTIKSFEHLLSPQEIKFRDIPVTWK